MLPTNSTDSCLHCGDGKGSIEIAPIGDDKQDERILARIAGVVPSAPDIAPALWGRF